MNMSVQSQVIAGLTAGIVFLILFFAFDMGIIVSVILSAAGYLGGLFLFAPNLKAERKKELQSAYNDGVRVLNEIEYYGQKINNQNVSQKISEIVEIGRSIFKELAKNINELRLSGDFLEYYLKTAHKAVKQYKELSSHSTQTPDMKEGLLSLEKGMDTIKLSFEKQLNKLLKDDIIEVDAELAALEETTKWEY